MTRYVSKLVVGGLLYVGLIILHPGSLSAQSSTLPDDLVCRECHSDTDVTHTFPSGETVSIEIDIDTLDKSPHSSSATIPTGCNDCHTGKERFRYPHQIDPNQTRQAFVTEVSGNCENCHYAHEPLHPAEDSDRDELEEPLPVCADCHGSHDIARVGEISEQMPAKCLACHPNQDRDWVDQYLSPRPGLGDGHEGYAGSTRCVGCHEDKYFSWQDTVHARLIQEVGAHPEALLADFDSVDADGLPFGKDDIAYTIGSQWRQAYLTRLPTQPVTVTQPVTRTLLITGTVTMTGTPAIASTVAATETAATTLSLLPMQWLVDSQEWAPLEEGGELPEDWITECGSCHVTGLDTETWGFTEFGIGCESCHGPAEAHARDPENVKPFAQADDQVCGSCHSRGTSTDGYHFPASYRPGEPLAEHFTFTTEDDYFWPDGSAKDNHQQYMDWTLGNPMATSGEVRCTTCHLVHNTGETGTQLRQPLNDLCLECHNAQRALVQHTPFHQQAMRIHSFQCTDCHMPKIVSDGADYEGAQFDLHSHAFQQPNPSATIEHGGLEFMPNSCNLCHDQLAEDPMWAQETINFAGETTASTSFFGPGPTPTSPPPPTPVASVGEPPAEIEIQPPLGWLRAAVFAMIGLIVVFGAAALVNAAVRRRKSNA